MLQSSHFRPLIALQAPLLTYQKLDHSSGGHVVSGPSAHVWCMQAQAEADAGDLKAAEALWLRAELPHQALDMLRSSGRWPEAVALAQAHLPEQARFSAGLTSTSASLDQSAPDAVPVHSHTLHACNVIMLGVVMTGGGGEAGGQGGRARSAECGRAGPAAGGAGSPGREQCCFSCTCPAAHQPAGLH